MGRKPQLFDRWGNPLRRAVLTEEVSAATIGGVRSPVSGYPADGLNPVRLAGLLRSADAGDPVQYLELAELIEERDLHYLGVLGTRRRQVGQIEITVEPGDDSAEAERHAGMVRDWLDRDELSDEIFDILDAIGKGYSFTEVIWDTSMGQWMPSRLERRDPRWFRFARHDLTTPLMLDENGAERPLDAFKFIYCQIKAKSGLPIRSGIARAASWGYMFKKFTERDWSIFSQTYGQPLRLGKFGPNTSDADKDTLFRAVANIAGDCAAIVPKSMDIDFVEAGNLSATGQLYRDRADWLDRQISKAVLGQTATTDAEVGGLGSGEEHGKVRQDIETADAKALAGVLNRDLVRPWIDLEFGPQRVYPRLRIARPEAEDLKAFTDAVTPWVDRGLAVSEQVILDKFGLEKAEEGTKILTSAAKSALATQPETPSPSIKRFSAPIKYPNGAERPDTPELQQERHTGRSSPLSVPREIADQLSEVAQGALSDVMAQLEAMIGAAGSLEEVREMLLAAYPDINTEPLADVLAEAMAKADAAGQIDVAEDAGDRDA